MYKVLTSCLTVKSTLCPYVESILGERSRTVARIKRENFHRGVSCIEPFGEPDLEDKHHREARGVPHIRWILATVTKSSSTMCVSQPTIPQEIH